MPIRNILREKLLEKDERLNYFGLIVLKVVVV